MGRGGRIQVRNNAGCAAIILGLLFMAIAFFSIRDTLTFLPGTLTAQGTIISCNYDADNGACSPTIHFVTQSGQSITVASGIGSSSFHQGESVSVKYHPDVPYDGRIDSFTTTWFVPLICGMPGLFIFILGLFGLARKIVRRLMGFSF
jgi:hypothetical protein